MAQSNSAMLDLMQHTQDLLDARKAHEAAVRCEPPMGVDAALVRMIDESLRERDREDMIREYASHHPKTPSPEDIKKNREFEAHQALRRAKGTLRDWLESRPRFPFGKRFESWKRHVQESKKDIEETEYALLEFTEPEAWKETEDLFKELKGEEDV